MASQSLSLLEIPGMTDGQVTEPVDGIGLRAQVEGNQNYKEKDELEVFWNDKLVFKRSVTPIEEAAGFLFYIEKKYIKLGDVEAYYTLSRDGNSLASPVLNLKVISATQFSL